MAVGTSSTTKEGRLTTCRPASASWKREESSSGSPTTTSTLPGRRRWAFSATMAPSSARAW